MLQKSKKSLVNSSISKRYGHQVHCEPRAYPLVIKYMGSKAKILDFIGSGFDEVYNPDLPIVDLFAGACSIAGGFGHLNQIITNDIQAYSEAIASCYLKPTKNVGKIDFISLAKPIVTKKLKSLPPKLNYDAFLSLNDFNKVEKRNRELINVSFESEYHLFTKNYSGTWWSAEQCVWIDTIREILDDLHDRKKLTRSDYMLGLSCLMHSMAYCGQGTGHYAQYRDAKTISSMNDINLYRQKNIGALFQRKLESLFAWNQENVVDLKHKIQTSDYSAMLQNIPKSIVYADPPYAFVHYSRFYHAIETLCKYDYPKIQEKAGKIVKGRYREERHQSPFSIKSQVPQAFETLFEGVKQTDSHLVLSYSNTGMISLEEIMDLANYKLGKKYTLSQINIDYQHKTMGRKADHSRNVQEALIIAKNKSTR